MICPYCGGEMRHGEITTKSTVIRWIEGSKPLSKVKKPLVQGWKEICFGYPITLFSPGSRRITAKSAGK